MNILYGVSGSVAAFLARKTHLALQEMGEVKTIITESSQKLIPDSTKPIPDSIFFESYSDSDEWEYWDIKKEVLHIELCKWADVLVIAPLSANTLAKMANGICDNLLTCVVRAWRNKPIIVAPAMNTYMWNNPLTMRHITTIKEIYGATIIPPVEKKLVCGDVGIGAMNSVDTIVQTLQKMVRWQFPIGSSVCSGIPVGNHPGAFGYRRKFDVHLGVDLYSKKNIPVYAVEDGIIVSVGAFTGEETDTPWWKDTQYIMIEGLSGVINYGEIRVFAGMQENKRVRKGDQIGEIIPVLPKHKLRKDIPGHSCSMLHLELYEKGTREPCRGWELDDEDKPSNLKDPTPFLLQAKFIGEKLPTLEME